MGFLDANGVTRLVTDLGNIFEYKVSAGGGIAINASNAISIATSEKDKLDHIYVQTPTSGGSGSPETYWSFGLANTSTPYTFSYWNGFNNGIWGDYFGFGTTNDSIANGGLRLYIGSSALGLRDFTNNTAGSYFWRMYPDELSPYQGVSNVTETACYGYGYTSATSGTMYLDIELSRRIRAGKTVTISAITAAIRGTTGIMKSNASNILSNVDTIAVASSGKLRLTLTGITTAFTANTPVHIYVNSITFSVSS